LRLLSQKMENDPESGFFLPFLTEKLRKS
jgi:hypothetical protein